MNPILKALSSGYTVNKVLDYLMKYEPEIAEKIKLAINAGYTGDRVLQFLMKSGKSLTSFLPDASKEEIGIYRKARSTLSPETKGFLKTVGALGGAVGAGLTARSIATAGASQAMPVPSLPATSPIQAPIGQQIEQQVKTPTSIQKVAQAAPALQQADPIQIIEQMGLQGNIESLRQAGNQPDAISGILETVLKPEQRKWLKSQTEQPFSEIIKQYITKTPEPEKSTFGRVITPDGDIAEIEDVPGKTAKINVGGKSKIVDTDKLIDLPIPEKDLGDLYEDVISGIEKKGTKVSRNVYWAGYDPNTNELAFVPHDGALYIYKDISEDDKQALTDMLTKRKTTGANYIGAWEEGSESPIGAAMSALIQRLQKERGGKGMEYAGKFAKIYDALEPAKQALKKKYEEEKRKRKTKKPRPN